MVLLGEHGLTPWLCGDIANIFSYMCSVYLALCDFSALN